MDNTVGREILTCNQKALIIGTLLGDGNLLKRYVNTNLRIDHGVVQKSYLFWKYKLLKNIATKKPIIIKQIDKRDGKIIKRWHFKTIAMPELNFYWNLFYPNSKKKIPENIDWYFSNPISLAVWIMDDGYRRNDCNAIRISSDGFSYKEQLILKECLAKNFDINTKIHKKGKYWNLYIPSGEMLKTKNLIQEYIIDSMKYKISPRNDSF